MPAKQRIAKIRRDYNSWVANEMLEDYALRFAPKSSRRWSELRIANTALGAVSFLALEAIGGALGMAYGFSNTFYAVLAIMLLVFLTGIPISYYAARYGVDIDLLTRGAGFGYIGSTITSLIYASYTFLFFALEAAIMSLALQMYFDIPLAIAHIFSALLVVPLVMYGITLINRFQIWSQPVWLLLFSLPFIAVISKNPTALAEWTHFGGRLNEGGTFNLMAFTAATCIGLSMVPQIGEQVDYLRFLPEKTAENKKRWWAAMIMAGPGWIIPGGLKMLMGAFLAFLALQHGVSESQAVEPTRMYLVAYGYVFASPQIALLAMVILVVISQIKINISNAYAGSLAWSNFFARMTHSHPGRVVWLVFNVLIALALMEMGVFEAIAMVLGLYANIATAWIGAVVGDLVINKPLGLSPKGIEFKRAHLHDINPVGIGAMLIASCTALLAHFGLMGPLAQVASPAIALLLAFVGAPAIAWLTNGRYYLARQSELIKVTPASTSLTCVLCLNAYELNDMASCPAYNAPICSLCCSLDARCRDLCKPDARAGAQLKRWLEKCLPSTLKPLVHKRSVHYVGIVAGLILLVFCALALVFAQVSVKADLQPVGLSSQLVYQAFLKVFLVLSVFAAILGWWIVLNRESRRVAQEESDRQTKRLMMEVEAHERTDAQLKRAKEASEAANAAKSRYVTGLSHELRTPLNSILGYAQILQRKSPKDRDEQVALNTIERSGNHLLSLIDGLLDVAKIETGKLRLDLSEIHLAEFLEQISNMIRPQAEAKGLSFKMIKNSRLPEVVRGDEKRIRQILINLLGNGLRFTDRGELVLSVEYVREIITFQIRDTGIGIPQDQQERLFEPFERGHPHRQDEGVGLGLTITRMLVALMAGEINVQSHPDQGSTFTVRLFLSEVRQPKTQPRHQYTNIVGYLGEPKRILVVDDQSDHRRIVVGMLEPLGFEMLQATNGLEGLMMMTELSPQLMLLDVGMPCMDGWQVLNAMRTDLKSEIPVIVISAHAFLEDRKRGGDLEQCRYLTKPLDLDALLESIQMTLGIEWIRHDPTSAESVSFETKGEIPSAAVHEMIDLAKQGYVKGILKRLDQLLEEEPVQRAFILSLRSLVENFQLREFNRRLQEMTRE
jgi:signal transduction histidine kinase/CheY-like chemotaxis protein